MSFKTLVSGVKVGRQEPLCGLCPVLVLPLYVFLETTLVSRSS